MPESWEQYSKWATPEGGEATFEVNLKHSLWAADVATWDERAPQALAHLRAMHENRLHLVLRPSREVRYGKVTISGTADCEDASGELVAVGRFEDHWDDVDALMDTLGAGDPEDDDQRCAFLACLPFADCNGTPGVWHEFEVRATTVEALLEAIDQEEAALLAESEKQWAALEAMYRDV